MSLSEAIRLGAMMRSQAFRTLFTNDGACALGAALLAIGAAPAVRSVLGRWPWAFVVSVDCPSCARSRLVCQVIAHLNDDHRWARERIGAWVAGIEPTDAQPPEDPPGGTMMRTAWAPSTIRGHADPVSCEGLAARRTAPVGDQPQDRQGARPDDPSDAAAAGGLSD